MKSSFLIFEDDLAIIQPFFGVFDIWRTAKKLVELKPYLKFEEKKTTCISSFRGDTIIILSLQKIAIPFFEELWCGLSWTWSYVWLLCPLSWSWSYV